MSVIHISGAEAARDFAALLARVREGHEVVIDDGVTPPVVLQVAEQPRSRTLSESLALAEAHAKEMGYEPVMDADFAADVAERIAMREMRGRSLADTLELVRRHAEESGSMPVLDPDFAADIEARIRDRKPRDLSQWG